MKTVTQKSTKLCPPAGTTETTRAPTVDELRTAFRFIEEEMETLAALACALVARLEPDDPTQIDCGVTNVYAWRIAEIIKERLESEESMNYVRHVMTGIDFPDRFV